MCCTLAQSIEAYGDANLEHEPIRLNSQRGNVMNSGNGTYGSGDGVVQYVLRQRMAETHADPHAPSWAGLAMTLPAPVMLLAEAVALALTH